MTRFPFAILALSGVVLFSMGLVLVAWGGDSFEQQPRWQVLELGTSNLMAQVMIPRASSSEADPGSGASFARLVAVPEGVTAEIHLLSVDWDASTGADSGLARDQGFSPGVPLVSLGRPAIMRGLRLVPVIIAPWQEDPERGTLRRCSRVVFELQFQGAPASPSRPGNAALGSRAFGHLYRNLILNYEEDPVREPGPRELYLIIVPDAYADAVQPLATWKRKMGFAVQVTTLSQIGVAPTAEQIRDYLREAYETWPTPPSFVVLIGDITGTNPLPAFQHLYEVESFVTDHPYACLEGDDYLPELIVGRISVQSVNDLGVVVSKIIGYESAPALEQTDWFTRALVVGGNYPSYVTTAIPTKRWVRDLLLRYGYAEVDTVFYPPTTNGYGPISAAVNEGITLLNYRGWGNSAGWHFPNFTRDDIQTLTNGWKLPVVTSIVCGTGNFASGDDPCMGEAWIRSGTPTTPRGAVAFFGPSPLTTHTRHNNSIDSGIYWGICEEGISGFGEACLRGQMELYRNFPLETDSGQEVEFYFCAYNLLGDPALAIWTQVPESLRVEHQPTLAVGSSSLDVEVRRYDSTLLSGAMVSLLKGSEVDTAAVTDSRGVASFSLQTTTADTLFVTVTGPNCIPYAGSVPVVATPRFVGPQDHSINDSLGNDDGLVSPGEEILLTVTLKNFGSLDTARSVTATLRGDPGAVTVLDSSTSYGAIPPQAVRVPDHPFRFVAAPACTSGQPLLLTLAIDSEDSLWLGSLSVPIVAAKLAFVRYSLPGDPNSCLDPGETAYLTVDLTNRGILGSGNVVGILRSFNPGIVVLDSIGGFGPIAVGDTQTNSGDRFQVRADTHMAIGHAVTLTMRLSGDGLEQEITFPVVVGQVSSNVPLGPCACGYFAYDNTDVAWVEAPTFAWVEIDPGYGGSGTLVPLGTDETEILDLPFTFRFFGRDYSRLSVCSNGWLAFDSTGITDHYNWKIPAAFGARSLVAPFWDYLDPSRPGSGDVFYHHDLANHRFVVEWSRVYNLLECPPETTVLSHAQTFEVVLLDPEFNPTVTGDGEIICQYLNVTNDDTCHNYCTVGIENEAHSDGIEYTFAGSYPPAAAPLTGGRAIKFTTDPPDTFPIGVSGDDGALVGPAAEIPYLVVFPNPLRGQAEIRYRGNAGSDLAGARLAVYNIAGQQVRRLFSRTGPAGFGRAAWDGLDDRGGRVSAGIYFVRLQAGSTNLIKRVVLAR